MFATGNGGNGIRLCGNGRPTPCGARPADHEADLVPPHTILFIKTKIT